MENDVPPSASSSCALDCSECGAVVGTEGAERGTLLLPCQHVLHMGCVEFIKRRSKLMMGMDSADVAEDVNSGGSSGCPTSHHSHWAREMHGRCCCPACYAPITHIIPLYLRSEDDPASTAQRTTAAPSTMAEEDFKRVHAAQKRVLLRLRGLCEQRRRMTELTHACAGLHERRAGHLANMEKEERCFPGLMSAGERDGVILANTGGSSGGAGSPSSSSLSFPIEHMGITELELYMAQLTPRLLRTQAEVRRERQVVERRTKKLTALRSHYHSVKELQALNAEIAARQARLHGRTLPAAPPAASTTTNALGAEATHRVDVTPSPQHTAVLSADAVVVQETQRQRLSAETVQTLTATPARKKVRGEEAINVDAEPAATVTIVEVFSCDGSEADEAEVTVVEDVDDVDTESAQDSSVEGREGFVDYAEEEESLDDAPYLIPCYVRTSTALGSHASAEPKTPHTTLTHNHVRMLPRREDRLWQPSLQF